MSEPLAPVLCVMEINLAGLGSHSLYLWSDIDDQILAGVAVGCLFCHHRHCRRLSVLVSLTSVIATTITTTTTTPDTTTLVFTQ